MLPSLATASSKPRFSGDSAERGEWVAMVLLPQEWRLIGIFIQMN
jgi:hypothetical protein